MVTFIFETAKSIIELQFIFTKYSEICGFILLRRRLRQFFNPLLAV